MDFLDRTQRKLCLDSTKGVKRRGEHKLHRVCRMKSIWTWKRTWSRERNHQNSKDSLLLSIPSSRGFVSVSCIPSLHTSYRVFHLRFQNLPSTFPRFLQPTLWDSVHLFREHPKPSKGSCSTQTPLSTLSFPSQQKSSVSKIQDSCVYPVLWDSCISISPFRWDCSKRSPSLSTTSKSKTQPTTSKPYCRLLFRL